MNFWGGGLSCVAVLGSLSILATTKLIRILMKRFHWRRPFTTAVAYGGNGGMILRQEQREVDVHSHTNVAHHLLQSMTSGAKEIIEQPALHGFPLTRSIQ
jgi:hypothetical protein